MALDAVQSYNLSRQQRIQTANIDVILNGHFAKVRLSEKVSPKKRFMAFLAISKFSKSNHKQTTSTFHHAIKHFLILGRCFAVFPVNGITGPNAMSLKFSYLSFSMCYSVLVASISLAVAIINLIWVFKRSMDFGNIGPFIWFSSNTFVMCIYMKLAKRWPTLMHYWEHIELNVSIVNPKHYLEMKRLITLATIGIPILSLIEHLLSIAYGIHIARNCKNVSGLTEAFFRMSYPGYYANFSYNMASGVVLQVLNAFCTFIWNFTDNFIIVISLGLTAQFQHFNAYFNQFKGKPLTNEFWGKQREYYSLLAELLYKVDRNIALITMISFSNNLYYICLQLFNSVAPSDSIIRAVYFWYSLFYLIGRTLLVSFSAARIYDESKRPALVLRVIPSVGYKVEAKRLLEMVTNTRLALSGMNFFHVTRNFILKVAGTVVTYELVLIQLQRDSGGSKDPCDR